MDSVGTILLVQIILIALNAVFACAEIAVISIPESKLKKMAKDGNKKAKKLLKLTYEPSRFLATIQVAITLSGFLASAFAAEGFSDPLVEFLISKGINVPYAVLDTLAVIFITLILSYFTLVFGELVPKRLAMRKAEDLALFLAPLLSFIATITFPIVALLTVSTNAILRLLGIDPKQSDEDVSEESIRLMVDTGSETGAIDKEEQEFIKNVFEFDDIEAREIATHRKDIVYLRLKDDLTKWQEIIHQHHFSAYPVCEKNLDNVVGILYSSDYFHLANHSNLEAIKSIIHKPYFVPETVMADVLFKDMRQKHFSFAVLIDEYSGVSGIVTLNDLIEQLIGNLGNHGHKEEPQIKSIDDNTWLISGNAPIDEVGAALHIDVSDKDYDTFSGLVFEAMKTIPKQATNIKIETDDLFIEINNIKNHQLESALVKRKEPFIQDKEE